MELKNKHVGECDPCRPIGVAAGISAVVVVFRFDFPQ